MLNQAVTYKVYIFFEAANRSVIKGWRPRWKRIRVSRHVCVVTCQPHEEE